MLWHELSWPQIDRASRETPVILPLAACEQHGKHLPLFVDTIQLEAIVERLNERLGKTALFAPVMWLGSSHHHKDFPGTLSLPPSIYSQVIQSLVRSVLHAGFRRIFLLNGHGGNEVPIAQALSELVAEQDDADASYLAMASWWKVAERSLKPQQHNMTTPAISHACEYETSLMLAIRPDLVDTSRIEECQPAVDNPWFNSEYGGQVTVFHRYHRFTQSGSMGRPSQASESKGQTLIEAVVDEVASLIVDMTHWPDTPPLYSASIQVTDK